MQFTAQELKQIERLRKRERQWPRGRWFLIATGIFVPVFYACLLFPFFGSLRSDMSVPVESLIWRLFEFLLFYPTCLLGCSFSGWLIVWTLVNWHGDVNRMLLLRLLDAQQKQASGGIHPAQLEPSQ